VYTFIITVAVFFMGLLLFNKTEKSFIDTVWWWRENGKKNYGS
jgi:hypothetical protein